MSKLFIIGNGFDSAHGLQTSYERFHQYLHSSYPAADENILMVPSVYQDKDGGLDCDDTEAVAFLIRIISEAERRSEEKTEYDKRQCIWSTLEASLGKLDYSEVFDELIEPLDEDGDIDDWENAYQNEDAANGLAVVIEKFSDYFAEWISTIDISEAKPIKNFEKLIRPGDIFLNFNYTETLEKLYGIDNVYHIHGKRGDRLIFGHGEEEDKDYDNNMAYHTGAEGVLQDIFYSLKKDTKKAMDEHDDFFKAIMGGIDCIYSHGFSFGEVDQPYIKRICEIIKTEDITWYLNDFDPKKIPDFSQQLLRAGFKGKIDTFSI